MSECISLPNQFLAPETQTASPTVVVVGGGATAFYTADKLIKAGYRVVMLNQDVAIGGGIRYFVRYDKDDFKMKLSKKFFETLKNGKLDYFGGIEVGQEGALTLEDISRFHPAAIVLAAGSRGKKELTYDDKKMEGSDLPQIYNAYDLALRYNHAPAYDGIPVEIGSKIVILGMGNVTADMIMWMAKQYPSVVRHITILGRRGPFESKIKPKEMREIAPFLDVNELEKEIQRVLPLLYQDRMLPYFSNEIFDEDKGKIILNEFKLTGETATDFKTVLAAMSLPSLEELRKLAKPGPKVQFRFLTEPKALQADGKGNLAQAILVENNLSHDPATLKIVEHHWRPVEEPLPVSTFIYSIGSVVDPELGLKVHPKKGSFKEVDPACPFRILTRDGMAPLFMFGWARRPSKGLVGEAKQDVEAGMPSLLEILKGAPHGDNVGAGLEELLRQRKIAWTRKAPVVALHEMEIKEGKLFRPNSAVTAFIQSQDDPRKDFILDSSV